MKYTFDPNCHEVWCSLGGDMTSFLPQRPLGAASVRHGPPPPVIYIFSNVKYPEENKIIPRTPDLLVFLNKAATIGYYADHKNKLVYHRSPKPDYGEEVMCCPNRYVFDAGKASIPKDFVDELKKTYDWNYPIEDGKIRCMTTGYMVVKYLQHLYPEREIVLVNFGYEVQHSTYRCPWHNWKFEAEALGKFRHLFLEEKK